MGRRASYAMISSGEIEYRSSAGAAPLIPRQVSWGPQWFALEVFFTDEATLPDAPTWAEGGVCADFDRRRLRLYGGETLPNCAGLQRWLVRLLSSTWSGWDVDWAHRGALEVEPATELATDGVPPLLEPSSDWLAMAFAESTGLVITWRTEGGRATNYRVDAGDNDIEQILAVGPTDLSARLAHRQPATLPRELDVPSGVFIDSVSNRVSYWYSVAKPDHAESLASMWPGWHVERRLDAYAGHLEASGQLDRALLLSPDEIERELTAELAVGAAGREGQLAQNMRDAAADGRAFRVPPLAAQCLADPMTPARQRSIFDAWMRREVTGGIL